MPVDNRMYDRLSHTWWDEDGFLNILRSGLNPSRFAYMRRILTRTLGLEPDGLPDACRAVIPDIVRPFLPVLFATWLCQVHR